MLLSEYIDVNGNDPFAKWYEDLNAQAAERVRKALIKMEAGNLSNAESVGHGVHEYKIDFGPGYRIYFGYDGEEIIILLGGGTKKRQQKDIEEAHELWLAYKREKKDK